MNTAAMQTIMHRIIETAYEKAKRSAVNVQLESVVEITHAEYHQFCQSSLPSDQKFSSIKPGDKCFYTFGTVGGSMMIHGTACVRGNNVIAAQGLLLSQHTFSTGFWVRSGIVDRKDARITTSTSNPTQSEKDAAQYAKSILAVSHRLIDGYSERASLDFEAWWMIRLDPNEWISVYKLPQGMDATSHSLSTADHVLYTYGTTNKGFFHCWAAVRDGSIDYDTLGGSYIDQYAWTQLQQCGIRLSDIHYAHYNLLSLVSLV